MKFKKVSLICAMAVTIAGSVMLPAFGMAYETTAGLEAGNSYTDGNYAAFNSGVSMDVSYGYEGNAKSGRYVPVNFSLKNQMDSEFQGTVQAIAMESDYDITSMSIRSP